MPLPFISLSTNPLITERYSCSSAVGSTRQQRQENRNGDSQSSGIPHTHARVCVIVLRQLKFVGGAEGGGGGGGGGEGIKVQEKAARLIEPFCKIKG